MALPDKEKLDSLIGLRDIVCGIRVFNRDAGHCGNGILDSKYFIYVYMCIQFYFFPLIHLDIPFVIGHCCYIFMLFLASKSYQILGIVSFFFTHVCRMPMWPSMHSIAMVRLHDHVP